MTDRCLAQAGPYDRLALRYQGEPVWFPASGGMTEEMARMLAMLRRTFATRPVQAI